MIEEKINSLNDMQKQAVLTNDAPLLLLAGAGSGKTRVLTHKIAYLIESGIRPFNILAITFTNKAAKEMKERVEQLIDGGKDVWISTFHSTCVMILRREIENIGYSSQFTIYDADDSEKIIKEIYKKLNINEQKFPIKSTIAEIGRQKDNLIDARVYANQNYGDFIKKVVAEIYIEYEKTLKLNNALDFDDLIFKTVYLFENNPQILEKYQDRFKYIMVDEYQDTSLSQYTLIKLLAMKYKNICVVGDDDQSIYGWRGADINNILNFEKDFENAKIIKLEQNYRSTKNILNAANFVIKNNFARKDKQLWTQNSEGSLITYNCLQDDKAEARFVVNEIAKKVKDGDSLKNFAVLYRANALSRVVEEQLVYSSIPYKIYGGTNFYSRKEIKDILAYIKILYNTSDDVSFKRIINVPKRNIGNVTVSKLSDYADKNEVSFFDALKSSKTNKELGTKANIVFSFYEMILEFINAINEKTISELINFIIEKTGYVLELQNEGTSEALSRIENIQEFINKAIEFEDANGNDATLERFLEEVALVSDIDTSNQSDDFVSLMSLHSSKGLEFENVFIIGFEEGIFPSTRAILSCDGEALEEERRLCYVGITRAKQKLYLTSCKSRLQHGRYVNNMKSSFFKEIPEKFLDLSLIKNINNSSNNIKTSNNSLSYKPSVNSYSREMPINKAVKIDFEVGDSVSHFKFRNGIVLKIDPAGADYEITVDFENFGIKKLMANLSKLKKI